MAEPSSFSIQELTGTPARHLVLQGRALPYRPLTFTGKMRAEFTWYPGNPIATVQMLGSEEGTTTINGMWKDRFLKAFLAFGFPNLDRQGSAKLDGAPVGDVASLVRVVDAFRRRGQLLEVTWDVMIRHGIMTQFRHTWLRHEDIEWEMEFTWISQGESFIPVAFGIDLSLLDLANQLLNAFNDLVAAVQSVFALVASITSAINDALTAIQEAVSAVSSIADQAAKAFLSPLAALQATVAAVQTIKDQCREIENTIMGFPARAMRQIGNIQDMTQQDSLEAEVFARAARKAARKLRALAARRQQELQAQALTQPQAKVITARDGQDLRSVSTEAYGTPDEWKRIAAYNRLQGSKLSAGTTVLIPRLNQSGRARRV